MKNVTRKQGIRNKSNVAAVGIDPLAAPGSDAQASPHGYDARTDRSSRLTIVRNGDVWNVVRVDTWGVLDLDCATVLVAGVTRAEALWECVNWSHALELPHDLLDAKPGEGWRRSPVSPVRGEP